MRAYRSSCAAAGTGAAQRDAARRRRARRTNGGFIIMLCRWNAATVRGFQRGADLLGARSGRASAARAARNAASARGDPIRPSAHAAWPRTSALRIVAQRLGERRHVGAVEAVAQRDRRVAAQHGGAAPAHRRFAHARERAPAHAQQRRADRARPGRRRAARTRRRRRAPALRLGGQASLQRSQPHTHVPISGRSARGIASRRCVRSLMQRVASIVRSPRSAPVGHTSTQRVHAAARRAQRRIRFERRAS